MDGEAAGLQPRRAVTGGEAIALQVPAPAPTHLIPEDRPLSILHQDRRILVVDKPAGLTVHPGHGQPQGTLANALVHHMQHLPELAGADRPGIVHRLDKDTSGVMVVALDEAAQRTLAAAFAARTVHKTYLAWVHGTGLDDEGRIEARIERSRTHRTRMAIAADGRGRAAQTDYVVEARWARHARVRCHPRTGRTHQLRVHLRSIGHPIVADPFYGSRQRIGDDLAPRLMLHAWRIAFDHPDDGTRVTYEAPVPEDLRDAAERLAALPPGRS